MTDQQRIAEIEARCEAATPGPWKVVEGKSFGVQSESKNIASCFRTENEQFIANSREDIPFLLAELDRLTEAIVKAGEMNPYKQPGNRDSYSQYNEGWQDAVNYIEASMPLPAAPEEGL